MQLIIILLVTISILTISSGLVAFWGSKKEKKIRSFWFFLATIFAAIWSISTLIFLTSDEGLSYLMPWCISAIFSAAMLTYVCFLGYVIWRKKYGKPVTISYLLISLILSIVIFILPNSLYSQFTYSNAGNSLKLIIGPLYILYIAYFCLLIPVIIYYLIKRLIKKRTAQNNVGKIVVMISFVLSSILTIMFNLVLPSMEHWNLSWIGPLAISATLIAYYYTILRHKVLGVSSLGLIILSYIIILALVAIIYMVIFSLVFAILFRGATPSVEVVILNFVMIIIFLLLTPVVNKLTGFIRRLIVKHASMPKKEEDK